MGRVDWDEMFRVLSDERRRRLLVALLDHNPQHDAVAVSDDAHSDDSKVDESQLQMFHTHLPTLEDAGFIRWDRDNHEVHKGPQFGEIRPLLELLENHRDELPDGWIETECAISK